MILKYRNTVDDLVEKMIFENGIDKGKIFSERQFNVLVALIVSVSAIIGIIAKNMGAMFVSIVALAALLYVIYIGINKLHKKAIDKYIAGIHSNPSVLEERTLTINEDVVKVELNRAEKRILLSEIKEVTLNKGILYIVKEDGKIFEGIALTAIGSQKKLDMLIEALKHEVREIPLEDEMKWSSKGTGISRKTMWIMIGVVTIITSLTLITDNYYFTESDNVLAVGGVVNDGGNVELDSSKITPEDAIRIKEKQERMAMGEEVEPEDTALKQFLLDLDARSSKKDVTNMAREYGLRYDASTITIIGNTSIVEVWEAGSKYNENTGTGTTLQVRVYNNRAATPNMIEKITIQSAPLIAPGINAWY